MLALLATALVLTLPATFLKGYDYVAMHGFYREYLRHAVLEGEFPWWNPFAALGRPFFADIETVCAYPPTWLILPFGVTGGVIAGVALHFWLAVWGTRRLALALGATSPWAWLAAVTFAGSGPLLARLQIGQLTVFSALCWLPWLFWLGVRAQDEPGPRAVVRLAAIECACLLAGSPNVFWISNCGLLVFLVTRSVSPKELGPLGCSLAGALLLAACLAAILLLPFIELILAGNRPLNSVEYATRHGMHVTTWLSLLVPLGGPFQFTPEFNQYIGGPLALCAIAAFSGWRRDRNLRALFVLGVTGFLFGSGDQLPVLGTLADLLPGFGAMRYPSRYGVLAALAGLLAGSVALSRWSSLRWQPTRRLAAAAQIGLLIVAAVSLSAHYRRPATGYWDAELRADLARHGFFTANGVPPRIAFDESRVRADSGLVEGYSTLGGFANPMLRNVWEAVHNEAGRPASDFDFHMLNQEIYRAGPFPMASAALVAGWDQQRQATVFRLPSEASPRAWIAAPETADRLPAQILSDSAVTISRFTRNTITLSARTPVPAVVVLAEPFYPGWRVTINGREQNARPINSWMRGSDLPAGENQATFRYRPRWLGLGALLSLFGLGTCILLWHFNRDRVTS